ncbi:HAD superfamily hydrolase (TIGR01509 family) [Streptomyces griseochromogenes]|uniref:HAD superfamily hydrolase (TIGR01509 family) n=1 Tax=Streptomyces griseochromogenes TaxID=68214 RepID=A0A1B1ASH7_9ACTN|nr:HAD family hydrolase [Streptomyces griseochromogenes]ANP49523.1 haloacid dehalogenase [Streptomyces griseochromogenes]MBP2053037.1 HAD superfamily hydrolase (TIGR01509 family) [Streptomyces griseochromogenes]
MDKERHHPVPVPVELVIFDCDGVLVDSERIAVRIHTRLGAEFGWPLGPSEVVDLFMGKSAASIRTIIADRLGEATATAWDEEFHRRLRDAFETGLRPVDGVVEALDRLRLPICVASSGTHAKLRHSLRHVGLYERFAGRVFSAGDVSRGKPAPDLFLHAAARVGVAPEACAVVEDSGFGVQAARAAGMRCFGYGGGLTPPERLRQAGAVVFDDMRELPRLLAGAGAGTRSDDDLRD